MKLTDEQITIIQSNENIKINAVAGSGKTTTVIEYARSRSNQSRILYLAFNRTVKEEAARKFSALGLNNVRVETAHSLAYSHVVSRSIYNVKSQSYKSHEIVELLQLKSGGELHAEYIIASHVNRFVSYFCNSNSRKVQELNYLNTVTDPKAAAFARKYYNEILNQTRVLLSRMDKGEIEITHDFYLKKYQLSDPQLSYDYILFDEGQDASPAMLDIFLKQSAIKLIVGDTHQQIYGWRFAVNSLENTDFRTFNLSASFRFCQPLADLAMEILKMKKWIGNEHAVTISGRGTNKKTISKAILARTNLGLLVEAINYVMDSKKPNRIYFEGNINSYTYADEGASLYDVLNLYNGRREGIRDSLIKQMKSFSELEDYIDKTNDISLGMMVDIVREYGNRIPGILRTIKERHVSNDEKETADMIFSTVHRCKGMEYDVVRLAADFITEDRLNNNKDKEKPNPDAARLNEEINLLYVAITRTANQLEIPIHLVPDGFQASPHIKFILTREIGNSKYTRENKKPARSKVFGLTDDEQPNPKKRYAGSSRSWSREEDKELTEMFSNGAFIEDLVSHFGRSPGQIRYRIRKLELEDDV